MKKIKAILFGSIGTLVETSDIQRESFNDAFKLTGLNWNWDEEEYRKLLKKSGGANRIKEYGDKQNIVIDGKKIRDLKTKIFNEYLNENTLQPRDGVIDIIKYTKKLKISRCSRWCNQVPIRRIFKYTWIIFGYIFRFIFDLR